MRKKPKSKTDLVRRRVLIVDRHALMRHAAAGWINDGSGLEVCGMADGVTDAFCAVDQLHPDVVVSEIMHPQDLGFIRELHRQHPQLPILVFSMQDAVVYAARARAAGACGYLMKEAGGEALVRSVRAVLRRRAVAGRKAG